MEVRSHPWYLMFLLLVEVVDGEAIPHYLWQDYTSLQVQFSHVLCLELFQFPNEQSGQLLCLVDLIDLYVGHLDCTD